ncbi:MAG: UPF0175 family protein [Thermoplasmatota archaeon]
MSKAISLRMPESLKKQVDEMAEEESKDKSTLIRELIKSGLKEKRIENALKKYEKGEVTLWKAATMSQESLRNMMKLLKDRKIEAQYGIEELEEDLKALGE